MLVYNEHVLFSMHGVNIKVTMGYFTRSGDVICLLGVNNGCLYYNQTPCNVVKN
jgi:hypothetical protein